MQQLRQKGYTLIEVMAALFIFIIIIGMISAALLQILNHVGTIKQKEQRLSDIQSMLSSVTFDFSQVLAKAQSLTHESTQIGGSFYTQNNSVNFIKTGNINPDNEFDRSALEKIQYTIDNQQLIKTIKINNQLQTQRVILLDNVSNLQWVFYDKQLNHYNVWPPTQDWQYRTPLAVKMMLNVEPIGLIEHWIELGHHE